MDDNPYRSPPASARSRIKSGNERAILTRFLLLVLGAVTAIAACFFAFAVNQALVDEWPGVVQFSVLGGLFAVISFLSFLSFALFSK